MLVQTIKLLLVQETMGLIKTITHSLPLFLTVRRTFVFFHFEGIWKGFAFPFKNIAKFSHANANSAVTIGFVRTKIFDYLLCVCLIFKKRVSRMILVYLKHVFAKVLILFTNVQLFLNVRIEKLIFFFKISNMSVIITN